VSDSTTPIRSLGTIACAVVLGIAACRTPDAHPGARDSAAPVATTVWPDGSPVAQPTPYDGAGGRFDSLHAWGMRWGTTRAEITARLGPPTRRSAAAEKNRHTDVMDTVYVLEYGGLRFQVRWTASSGDLLTAVTLSNDPGNLPGGVRVGSTTRQGVALILAVEPERSAVGDSALDAYLLPSRESPEYVQFYFVRDTLRRIAWIPYVD
jgi:hypothetical protein